MKHSAEIGKIAEALAKAQLKMKTVAKDSNNPHFGKKYASLDAVIDMVRPPLGEQGIAVSQTSEITDNGNLKLITTLFHTSGEWISSEYPVIPTKPDPQGLGSAYTYARRYTLQAILNVAHGDDDDGNEASKNDPEPKKKPAYVRPNPSPGAQGQVPSQQSAAGVQGAPPGHTHGTSGLPQEQDTVSPWEPDLTHHYAATDQQKKWLGHLLKERGVTDKDVMQRFSVTMMGKSLDDLAQIVRTMKVGP